MEFLHKPEGMDKEGEGEQEEWVEGESEDNKGVGEEYGEEKERGWEKKEGDGVGEEYGEEKERGWEKEEGYGEGKEEMGEG